MLWRLGWAAGMLLNTAKQKQHARQRAHFGIEDDDLHEGHRIRDSQRYLTTSVRLSKNYNETDSFVSSVSKE
jgi:hypothetical protein